MAEIATDPAAGTPKAGDPPAPETVQVPKADVEALTALRTRYTPPEKYDLKLPDGSTVDASLVEKTAATARKLGLSQKDAEELLNFSHGEITARQKAEAEANTPETGAAWKARVETFEKEALADKDIGGTPEKLKENADLAKRVLDHFEDRGGKEIKAVLLGTGLGSNLAVIKFLSNIGRSMKEADFVKAPASGDKPNTTAAERMYPTNAKKES